VWAENGALNVDLAVAPLQTRTGSRKGTQPTTAAGLWGLPQQSCKVRQNVILSAAKNLRGHYVSPRVLAIPFAAFKMTDSPTYSKNATLQFSWGLPWPS
jgi:hypothetical protein